MECFLVKFLSLPPQVHWHKCVQNVLFCISWSFFTIFCDRFIFPKPWAIDLQHTGRHIWTHRLLQSECIYCFLSFPRYFLQEEKRKGHDVTIYKSLLCSHHYYKVFDSTLTFLWCVIYNNQCLHASLFGIHYEAQNNP